MIKKSNLILKVRTTTKKMLSLYYVQYILLGIALILLPILQSSLNIPGYVISAFGMVMYYSVVAIGMSLLLGYSGLISLGTAGFMGLAAYISSYLTHADYGVLFTYELSFILAIIIPVIVGLLVGIISLRIEGYYLAIATLAIAEILRKLFETMKEFTKGPLGSHAELPNILGIQFTFNDMYIFMAIVLVILMILVQNMIRSATGRALLTMRGSEAAAQAMGINIVKYRVIVFGLATMFASIGGVLYVHFITLSYPYVWNLGLSLNIVAVVIIGGVRSIGGTVLGSFIIIGLSEIVFKQIPALSKIDGLPTIITGVLIIIVIMFYPKGLMKMFSDLPKYIKKGIIKIKNSKLFKKSSTVRAGDKNGK